MRWGKPKQVREVRKVSQDAGLQTYLRSLGIKFTQRRDLWRVEAATATAGH
jgi:hypothetical protein